MKLTDAEKCANLGNIKIKNKKSMSKESTSRNDITESCRWWKSSMEFLMEWVCETPGERR